MVHKNRREKIFCAKKFRAKIFLRKKFVQKFYAKNFYTKTPLEQSGGFFVPRVFCAWYNVP